MADTAFYRATASGLDLSDRKAVRKRVRLRRQIYLAQGASYIVDAFLLWLYYLAGTTAASSAIIYLIVGLGWTASTLALSERHFNE